MLDRTAIDEPTLEIEWPDGSATFQFKAKGETGLVEILAVGDEETEPEPTGRISSLLLDDGVVCIAPQPVEFTWNGRRYELSAEKAAEIAGELYPEQEWAVANEEQMELLELNVAVVVIELLRVDLRMSELQLSQPQKSSTWRETKANLRVAEAQFCEDTGLDEGGLEMFLNFKRELREPFVGWGFVDIGSLRRMLDQVRAVLGEPEPSAAT